MKISTIVHEILGHHIDGFWLAGLGQQRDLLILICVLALWHILKNIIRELAVFWYKKLIRVNLKNCTFFTWLIFSAFFHIDESYLFMTYVKCKTGVYTNSELFFYFQITVCLCRSLLPTMGWSIFWSKFSNFIQLSIFVFKRYLVTNVWTTIIA